MRVNQSVTYDSELYPQLGFLCDLVSLCFNHSSTPSSLVPYQLKDLGCLTHLFPLGFVLVLNKLPAHSALRRVEKS